MSRGHVTRMQAQQLLKPVPTARIEKKQGLSYLPQHEARAQLIRIFGPGNVEHTMLEPELLYETRIQKGEEQYPTSGNKPSYYVTAYKAGCNLRVFDYDGELIYDCTEWHVEENAPLPNRGEAHAMACTSAQSYALRRAALSLGDALGLHLYEKGQAEAFVRGSLLLAGDPESPLFVAPPESNTSQGGVPAQATSVDRLQAATNVRDDAQR
jgi:hypothetical protein